MRAEHVDGEELADLVGVLPEVVRRWEEHPATGDDAAEPVGVVAAEVGELEGILAAVEQEQLGHADATVHSWPVVKVDKEGERVRAGHLEQRDDASPTGEHDDRESLLGMLAIHL